MRSQHEEAVLILNCFTAGVYFVKFLISLFSFTRMLCYLFEYRLNQLPPKLGLFKPFFKTGKYVKAQPAGCGLEINEIPGSFNCPVNGFFLIIRGLIQNG